LGEGIPQITRRVQAITNSCLNQARRIARTETLRCLNQGRYLVGQQVRDEFGLQLTKTWHAATDERTREDHNAANGQTVDFEEPFIVGGEEMQYPLDPNGRLNPRRKVV